MGCDDQVIHAGTLGFNALAGLHPKAKFQALSWEGTSWHTQLHQVLLVLLAAKAQVGAL